MSLNYLGCMPTENWVNVSRCDCRHILWHKWTGEQITVINKRIDTLRCLSGVSQASASRYCFVIICICRLIIWCHAPHRRRLLRHDNLVAGDSKLISLLLTSQVTSQVSSHQAASSKQQASDQLLSAKWHFNYMNTSSSEYSHLHSHSYSHSYSQTGCPVNAIH